MDGLAERPAGTTGAVDAAGAASVANTAGIASTASTAQPDWAVRRFAYFTAVFAITAASSWYLADLLSEGGTHAVELAILIVFALNFAWIAGGFVTAAIGFLLTVLTRDPIGVASPIARSVRDDGAPSDSPPRGRTAIVMPVYNEQTSAVFAGLRAMDRSLRETGFRERFAFFVVSDTDDPAIAAAEEAAVAGINAAAGSLGGVTYRRREINSGKKAGNIADFCQRWGDDYDYMVVLDADSIVTGPTLVRLARMMDANPRAGIVQTLPRLVGQSTLFGRIEQFGYRLCCNVMALGLAYWQGPDGNYFGHNAIVRLAAFRDHCELPLIGGKGALSGEIMSHDFVEAALMRRGGYDIWFVPDSRGSFESCPSNAIDHAKRDRRWCQGNLQHARLLALPGLKPISRLHLVIGIVSYLASLCWLSLIALGFAMSGAMDPVMMYLSDGVSLFPKWPMDRSFGFFSLLLITVALLFAPKLFGLLVLVFHPRSPYRRTGRLTLLAGGLCEALYSVLRAPVLMVFHSLFIAMIVIGRRVGWAAQVREARAIDARSAFLFHLPQTVVGLLILAVTLLFAPEQIWWMVPVLAGLALCVPLTVATGSVALGKSARAASLFVTPEEASDVPELRHLAPKSPPGQGTSAPDARPADAAA